MLATNNYDAGIAAGGAGSCAAVAAQAGVGPKGYGMLYGSPYDVSDNRFARTNAAIPSDAICGLCDCEGEHIHVDAATATATCHTPPPVASP